MLDPMVRYPRCAAWLLSGSLLTACITPPRITPLDRPVDTRVNLGLQGAPVPVQQAWWTAYQDAQLNRLVETALNANPTLQGALARLRLAQALVAGVNAGRWPEVSYDAATARERLSAKDAIPPQYGGADVWRSHEGLNFSWDLDLWGRQAAVVHQFRSEAQAVALDGQAARLAIVAAVVHTYIDLQRAFDLVDVARRAEQQRQKILNITQHRVTAGLDTNVELRQAAGAVPDARVERLHDQAIIDRDIHLLSALCGEGAVEYSQIGRPGLQPAQVVMLPSALPIDLLARRPDILAARLRVSAASAGIDAAKADFYPNIDLLAFAGTVAVGHFDNLFSPHAASYGAGPAVHLPVFDAGRLRANYRVSAAEVNIAVTNYDRIVLAAVKETADQLSDIASLETSLAEQKQSLDDAEAAFRLATERYTAGLTTYLSVLSTETRVLNARRQRVELESARASASVTLLVDVGGDFNADPAMDPAPVPR